VLDCDCKIVHGPKHHTTLGTGHRVLLHVPKLLVDAGTRSTDARKDIGDTTAEAIGESSLQPTRRQDDGQEAALACAEHHLR
jgi:hypothetical protein